MRSSLLVVATNPYALIFLLPSLHAWLWLPQVSRARPPVRLGVLALGFAGPALLIGEFAGRYGSAGMRRGTSLSSASSATCPFIVMPLLVDLAGR